VIYSTKKNNSLFIALQPIVQGLGMELLELIVTRQRSVIQVQLTITMQGNVGIEDCSRVHHAIMPRLELAFPQQELYLEVASPGIDRTIRDAFEFQFYIGRGVRCYRSDASVWVCGVIKEAGERSLILENKDGSVELLYDSIGKAKLDNSQEVTD
jgi:ribosome maturation factor RimP